MKKNSRYHEIAVRGINETLIFTKLSTVFIFDEEIRAFEELFRRLQRNFVNAIQRAYFARVNNFRKSLKSVDYRRRPLPYTSPHQ